MTSIDVENPKDVWAEVEAAKVVLRSYLGDFSGDVKRMAGPAYQDRAVTPDPENHAFEFLALFNPQLVWGSPQFRITTSRFGEAQTRSRALQLALNRWVRLTRMRECNEAMASDFALRWAVARVGTKPYPGTIDVDDPPRLPFLSRVSPHDGIWDPHARHPADAQFTGFRVRVARKALLKHAKANPQEGWDVRVLETKQAPSAYGDEVLPAKAGTERDEVDVWTLWFPTYALPGEPGEDEGFHGTLVTVVEGVDNTIGWSRKPRPFFGPRTGPLVWGGAYYMSDHFAPLSPIQATQQQADYLNDISRAVIRSVESYKRVFITSSAKLAQIIKDSPHDLVHHIDQQEVAKAVASLEIGGLTQQLMAAKEDARITLDRVSGIHDAQRGNVTGAGTATEVAAAQQWSAARSGFVAQKFKDMLSKIGATVAYYFDRDESVVIDLGEEGQNAFADEMGPIDHAIFRGGLQRHESPEDFDAMDFSIEAFSVDQSTESQLMVRRQAFDMVTQTLAAVAPSAPHIPWDEWLRVQSELTQQPDLERLLDMGALRKVQQLMMQQPIQAKAQSPATPRMSSDVGGGGGGAGFRGGKGPGAGSAKAPPSSSMPKFEPAVATPKTGSSGGAK